MTSCELWSDFECAGGVSLGSLRLSAGTWSTSVAGDEQCELTVHVSGRVVPALRLVLRIMTDRDEVREYRIVYISRANTEATHVLRGLSPLADLGTAGLVRDLVGKSYRTTGLGAPYTRAAFLTQILFDNAAADGIGWWAVGTADDTALFNIAPPSGPASRLAWLKALQEATGDEVAVRRNGAVGYYLDVLPQIGAGSDVVRVGYGRNLLALQEDQDDTELATAITVLGPEGYLYENGLGENAWVLGTATGSGPYWIPLTDYASGAAAPVVFDAQFTGAALLTKTGTTVAISDVRASDSAVQVAALTGLTAGDLVQIVADTSARRMTELREPSAKRLLRVDTGSRTRGQRNLARNGDFAAATALVPDRWTIGSNVAPAIYRRDTTPTFSYTGGTGGVSSTTLTLTAGPANSVLYEGDTVSSGGSARTVAATVQLDGAGAGAVTLRTAITLANGSTITNAAGFVNRRIAVLPNDGAPSTAIALWIPDVSDGTYGTTSGWTSFVPASAWGMRSETVTVKYVAGVTAYVHAQVQWSARAGVQEIANRDASFLATEVEAATVTRCLPSLMIGKPSTSTRLGYVLHTTPIAANSEAHATLGCSAVLTADTDVSLQFFGLAAYNTGLGRQYYPTLLRSATLWISGSSEQIAPDAPLGDSPTANLLWHRGNRGLLARRLTRTQIRISLLDLSRVAGYSITRDALVLGGDIEAVDLNLTLRVVGLVYDAMNPTSLDVIVDSRPKRLSQFLAER